jgi:hypothetical protein
MQCARECGDFVLEGSMVKLDKKLQLKIGKKLREIFADLPDLPERDPPPFSGAPGLRPHVEKRRVNAARLPHRKS